MLPIKDKEWGERLIALVRWQSKEISESSPKFASLKTLVNNWLPAERPISWVICPTLSTNEKGKWERGKWSKWLERLISKSPTIVNHEKCRGGSLN